MELTPKRTPASDGEWTPPEQAGIHLTTPKRAKYYKMNHKSRGNALIFNHSNWEAKSVIGGKRTPYSPRDGSENDAENLKKCLCWLGFSKSKVKIHNNYTLDKIKKSLKKVSRMDHTGNDCLFICIMTHGENGKLVDNEGTCYHLDQIWTHFTPENCPSLAGKPKLIFIQACRGSNTGALVDIRMDNQSVPCFSYTIPSLADFLLAFSTTEDSVSWRCPANGSWFIQSFCQMLCKYPQEDLLSLLVIVSRQVAVSFTACICPNKCSSEDIHNCPQRIKQVPQVLSTLMRKVQFEPIDDLPPIGIIEHPPNDEPLLTCPTMPVSKYAENYNMNHKNTGVAVIISCHKWSSNSWDDLPGYVADQERLVTELQGLSFDIRGPYENLTFSEINKILSEVAKEDHTQNDTLLVAVMTHGTDEGDLIDSEGVPFSTDSLWKGFRTNFCKTLDGKPKIFLIQACRGDEDDRGTRLPEIQSDMGTFSYTLPPDSDFLMFYSSVEGYTSFVQSVGSSFFQSVCHALSKCSPRKTANSGTDFLSVLTEASMKVALATLCDCSPPCPPEIRDQCKRKAKQMPQMVSTIIRSIKFQMKNETTDL